MPTGRVRGAATAQDESKFIVVQYLATFLSRQVFTAPYSCILTDAIGVPIVAGTDGSAVTISIYKTKSGVAPASGTLLTTGTLFDAKGTINTVQILTLIADLDSRTLQTGDSISFVLAGTATAAIGEITLAIEPA